MPEYLAPGVYVEETSFRSKSIEGVSTSVGGLVGPTRTGPTRGRPVLCTSFADFEDIFGDASDLVFTGEDADELPGFQSVNATCYAARAFFDNGGKQLWVKRVVAGANDDDAGRGSGAFARLRAGDANVNLTLTSRFVGEAGNVFVEFHPRAGRNLRITTVPIPALVANAAYTLRIRNVAAANITGRPANNAQPAAAAFPLREVIARATRAAGGWEFVAGNVFVVTAQGAAQSVPVAQFGTGISDAAANATYAIEARELAFTDDVDAGAPVMVDLRGVSAADPLHAAIGLLADQLPRTPFFATTTAAVAAGRAGAMAATLRFNRPANVPGGAAGDVDVPLALLAGVGRANSLAIGSLVVDIDVRKSATDAETGATRPGETLVSYGDVQLATEGRNAIVNRLPETPAREAEFLTQPVWAAMAGGGGAVWNAMLAAFDADLRAAEAPGEEPRLVLELAGGGNGTRPEAVDYAGEVDERNGSTGFAALEQVEDVSIVMCPAAAQLEDDQAQEQIVLAMQAHCRRMRFRVGIVDAPHDRSVSEVLEYRNRFSDDRLALYHPWIETASMTPGRTGSVFVPPGGFIGGVYAGTDVARGVHKAPANEVVIGASGLEKYVNTFQQEVLNPQRVNCIRFFPGRGIRVWGARTLGQDPEWMYVNVRRYFLYLERSIQKSTDWVVFEPNGEDLWANVRATVDDFLYNEFANRRLLGASPEEAYFVRCDRSTMTQNDLDNGRLVCLVGVAPLRPAEFVIFRIGQKTADAK